MLFRRLFACLLLGCLLLGAFPAVIAAEILCGDLDASGKIDARDYMMAKRYVLGTYELAQDAKERADVNGDGKADARDYMMIKRHALGTFTITATVTRTSVTASLIADKQDAASMAHNTKELQRCVDEMHAIGGGTVYLPAGTFHFSTQGMNARQFEDYVCMPRDNVTVIGKGEQTVLKPVGETKGGLDMFYFNEYADSSFKNPKYLVNADFYDFVIDGELAHARNYTSAGKGFMINLYRDCDFARITVKNTDGTGFGMDCPINCTIIDCKAYGCGKAATTDNVGASGFGIGTGYCNDETILIDNCYAEGNKKFGIFFEHQGRFGSHAYQATSLKNLLITNCTAKNNYIDFGGELAVDVTYRNCTVLADSTAVSWIAFKHYSIRCKVENMDVQARFADVSDESASYYDAVYWAVNQGITTGVGDGMFDVNGKCTYGQMLTFLYRSAGYPGDLKLTNKSETNYYDEPLAWAKKNGIVIGTFDAGAICTTQALVEMLWRYAGCPEGTSATEWALSVGLIDTPADGELQRGDAVTMLYRYFS